MKNFIKEYWLTISVVVFAIGISFYTVFIYEYDSDYESPTQAETLQEMQTSYDIVVELSDEINDIVASTPEGAQTTSEAMVVTLLTAQETLDRCVDEARTYGYILDDYTYDASLEEQDELYALLAENDLPLGTDGVRAKCLQFTYPN